MVSQFKTGKHGELFYTLLILKKFQWPGEVSVFKESQSQGRGQCSHKKAGCGGGVGGVGGVGGHFGMRLIWAGSTALSLISYVLRNVWIPVSS